MDVSATDLVVFHLCCMICVVMPFKTQIYFSFTQTEVTVCWEAVCTWSWPQLQERSWGKIVFYSSHKWSFELASVPSMPWQKKCFGAVALGGSGRRSRLLYSTSISPVINCLRKDRLSNYGCALHRSTPMFYSQTVLEQNKAASVSVTDSYWDFIGVELVSVLVALLTFPLFQNNAMALAFFFSKRQSPCLCRRMYLCICCLAICKRCPVFAKSRTQQHMIHLWAFSEECCEHPVGKIYVPIPS